MYSAIRHNFPLSRMTSNKKISPMKLCYHTNCTLPEQSGPSSKTDLDFWYCFRRTEVRFMSEKIRYVQGRKQETTEKPPFVLPKYIWIHVNRHFIKGENFDKYYDSSAAQSHFALDLFFLLLIYPSIHPSIDCFAYVKQKLNTRIPFNRNRYY